jgi:hypothetical protein
MFHVSLLEFYHASTKSWAPPLPMKIDGEQKYEMEDFLIWGY